MSTSAKAREAVGYSLETVGGYFIASMAAC